MTTPLDMRVIVEEAAVQPMPLRRLREGLNFHPKTVVERGSTKNRHFPKSIEHLYMIETRGTSNYFVITTLSEIYGVPHSDMARLADYQESNKM